MRRLFDPNSPIMRFLSQAADLAVLSLLFTVCSLPVVTLGASAAALSRTAMSMARGRGDWNARAFFRAFRDNFRKATFLWLILLGVGAVLAADILILSGGSRILLGAAVMGAAVWVIAASWAFPLTAQFENAVGATLKNALLLGLSWLPRSLLMGCLWLLPIGMALVSPAGFYRVAILWPVLLWAVTAYTCALLLKKPFAPYMDGSEPKE